MMLYAVDGFEWDAGNWEKCQQHGVSIFKIEALFGEELHVFPDVRHSLAETRYFAIGKPTGGRYVFLAFTLRTREGIRFIRPISARYMHAKEVKHYEAQIAKTKNR